MAFDPSTPVLLLGGRANTLSVTRNFGRLGIAVSVSAAAGCKALYSRYCQRKFLVPENADLKSFWYDLLLADNRSDLEGHIVIACCDNSLQFMETHRKELQKRYVLEEFVPELRRVMLDKQDTLRLAKSVDVPVPNHWTVKNIDDILKVRDEIKFPVMVKPILSHAFTREFGAKLFIIENEFNEVIEKIKLAHGRGHEVMVVEMIPGPDDLLVSYYTYIDRSGRHLYHYTKRVLRRWPLNRGGGTYHISEWLPDVAQLGQKFFDAINWQGFANIEFKRDQRDGKMKVIEVNARFTAAHRLVVESGAPIDKIIYCHLTDQEIPKFDTYDHNLRMWFPYPDFMSLIELKKMGRLTLGEWFGSLLGKKIILPYFSISDPVPMIRALMSQFDRIWKRVFRLFGKRKR